MIDYESIVNTGLNALSCNQILYDRYYQFTNYPYNETTLIDVWRFRNAYFRKISRIKTHINYATSKFDYSYFITITYNEFNYNKSKILKVSRDIKNSLKDIDCFYLFHKDFGSKNDRLHFHIILFTNDLNFQFNWCRGFSNTKKIKDINDKALSHYLIKYAYHSNVGTRIYYSFKCLNDKVNSDLYKWYCIYCEE